MAKINSILGECGLTEREIEIYIALLQFGPCQAGAIIKQTGRSNSVVHLTLGRLLNLGLATYTEREHKLYSASDPAILLKEHERKGRAIQSAVQELRSIRSNQPSQSVTVYEGLQGFRSMCYNLIENTKPGEHYYFFAFRSKDNSIDKSIYEFYREFTVDRIRRRLEIFGIAHESAKKRFIKNKWPHENILFVKIPTIENCSVCGDKVIFTPWENDQTAFLVHSPCLARQYADYFRQVWNQLGGKPRLMESPSTKSE